MYYRLYYWLQKRLVHKAYNDPAPQKAELLKWKQSFSNPVAYDGATGFTFLNLSHQEKIINWNYDVFGKLWTYNLNYFDFLLQKGISREQGLFLMRDYIKSKDSLKDGVEPYPFHCVQ